MEIKKLRANAEVPDLHGSRTALGAACISLASSWASFYQARLLLYKFPAYWKLCKPGTSLLPLKASYNHEVPFVMGRRHRASNTPGFLLKKETKEKATIWPNNRKEDFWRAIRLLRLPLSCRGTQMPGQRHTVVPAGSRPEGQCRGWAEKPQPPVDLDNCGAPRLIAIEQENASGSPDLGGLKRLPSIRFFGSHTAAALGKNCTVGMPRQRNSS